jgi:hypothetical protein
MFLEATFQRGTVCTLYIGWLCTHTHTHTKARPPTQKHIIYIYSYFENKKKLQELKSVFSYVTYKKSSDLF